VVVKYGHTTHLKRIRLIEAGHPVPDANGLAGAKEVMRMVSRAGPRDLIIALMSGGGSALWPMPARGLSLSHKQAMIRTLLACGASIHEINTLRKHTSGIKGGQLARAAHPAPVVALIVSDVVGDDLDVIASGPTVPDSSTFQDCIRIVNAYDIRDRLPAPIRDHLAAGAAGKLPETPASDHPAFYRSVTRIVAGNMDALTAAAEKAHELGYDTLILSAIIEGETREVARVHGAIARQVLRTGHPLHPPACILSGGETTVTLTGDGKGGRNQEFALAAALDIAGYGAIVVLSGGTDGTDGPTDAAGAIADGQTVDRARRRGLDPAARLRANDAYPFFEALDDLLITGPTDTNVMDLRILLVR
jgi:hydroxypyruvate reductase